MRAGVSYTTYRDAVAEQVEQCGALMAQAVRLALGRGTVTFQRMGHDHSGRPDEGEYRGCAGE